MKGLMTIKFLLLSVCTTVLMIIIYSNCDRDESYEVFYEEEDLLISAYLEEHSDEFSSLLRVLEITRIKQILNAYGHYTFFAPDNNAFDRFCKDNGRSSVEDFDIDYLTTLVKYHLLDIDIETNFLPNGVLPDTNYTGDNLIFSFAEGGLHNIMVNGEATITERDIKVENGYINKINGVLTPVFLSVYDKLTEEEQFTLFARALEATGLSDTLSQIRIQLRENKYIKSRFTIFTESDQVFNKAGIHSLNDLKMKYSDSEDITSPDNGLYKFIAYHCVPGLFYLNQLDSTNYHTLARNKLISVDLKDDIYLNWHTYVDNGQTKDSHIKIIRDDSNNPTKNGVYHSIDKLLEVYDPDPVFVKIDFTDYQGIDINNVYTQQDIEYINGLSVENTGLWYRMSILDEDSSYLETTSRSLGWTVEFDLPPITKGTYKVFVHWVSDQDRCGAVQAFWDDQILGYEFSMERKKRPPKRPPEWVYDFRVAHELGVVLLSETKPHKIKFIALKDGLGEFDYLTLRPD